jgi:AcrR family transcriptional regulator
MEVKPSRIDRADSTRKTLLRHASQLFTQKGYAEASTDEVVRRAKLTKGALYHHFANKLELYRAVVEDMACELVARMDAAVEACPDPASRIRASCHAYLDACLDAKLARILVIEAPVVLGWKAWCNIAQENEVATLARRLGDAMAAGMVHEQPLETMAQVLLGALNTSARVITTAENPAVARAQVEETIERLLRGLGLPEIRA